MVSPDAILLIAPTFMFVITVSGAIHVNYYRDRLGKTVPVYCSGLAFPAAPTLLAVTTCIGLMSLTSVRWALVQFGVYSR